MGHDDVYYPFAWLFISFVFIWFLLVSLPPVIEDFLDWEDKKYFDAAPAWHLMNFFVGM